MEAQIDSTELHAANEILDQDPAIVANEEIQRHDLSDEENIDIGEEIQGQDLIDQPMIEFYDQGDEEEGEEVALYPELNDISTQDIEEVVTQDSERVEEAEKGFDSQKSEEDESSSDDGNESDDEESESMDVEYDSEQHESTDPMTNIEERPYDDAHVNLLHYNPLATAEENLARAQNLDQHGVFFTKEAYNYYFPSEYADLFSFSNACHEASMALHRKKLAKEQAETHQEVPVDLKSENQVEEQEDNPSLKRKRLAEEMTVEASKETPPETIKEAAKTQEAKTKKSKSTIAQSKNEPTVFDQVLTSMLRAKQPQQQQQEPSDLEIVAMAAGLGSYEQGGPSNQRYQQPRSRYTKEQHRKFLENAAELRRGKQLSEADAVVFQKMCQELKVEKSEFIQHQCRKILQSGVYNSLDPKAEKMIETYYELERARLKNYPQYYKYFNILDMPTSHAADHPILSFKKSLYATGNIASCREKMFDTPRKLDLFKQYISASFKENSGDDDNGELYKKKLPPNVSIDPIIPKLLAQYTNNKPDIIISSECLIAFVEMFNDLSKDICIPVVVTDEKTIIFDNPLPKETLTARERNKMVYDWTFKSFCLDWIKRKPVNSSQPALDTKKEETKSVEGDVNWDSEADENLHYNIWAFGDMNILIRHQMDGEYKEKPRLRGSKDKMVCLTAKLDYQIAEGSEEMVTPAERAANWMRSYIGGHTTVFEGRIDVVNNRLMRVDRKEMLDIMTDNWRPSFESETLRHTFLKLKKMLLPGNYILRHKSGDRNFLVYQSMSTRESSVDVDLYAMFKERKPSMGNPESSFIPAWLAADKYDEKERIAWTFPPK